MRKFYVFVSVRDDAKLVQDDRDNEKKKQRITYLQYVRSFSGYD